MTNITRRDFLKNVSAVGAVASSGLLTSPLHAWTAGADKYPPSLVCIYLRGGADWLNMVIPYKDRDYFTVRPTLALGEEQGVIKLDGKWGLHPALSAFQPLFQAKMLAPVVAVGSPHTTRSHFDAQDFMECAAPGTRGVPS
nr:twin-arginine translocation signal domain-containing protein [Planctomycetota bacterium]